MSCPSDWNLENFAKFWADIEYEEGMRQKAWLYYRDSDYDDFEPEDWDEPEEDPDWDLGDY